MICELLTPPVLRLTGLRHRYLQPRFDLEARPEVRVVSALQDRDVSVIGVYGGFIDKFPSGSWMNRSLTLRTGQCHVQRYLKPLLQRIEHGEIDPTRVITHTVTGQVLEISFGFDQVTAGIQGSPSASMIRASKKARPCLAAVDR